MTNDARVPAGVPTGGQFAVQNRPEADVRLPEGNTDVVAVTTAVQLSDRLTQLAPYPAGLPEPTVSFDWSDSGTFETYVDVDGHSYIFWNDFYDGWQNNIDHDPQWGEPWPFPDVDEDRFTEWANSVAERTDTLVAAAGLKLYTPQLRDAIQATALGKAYQAPAVNATAAVDVSTLTVEQARRLRDELNTRLAGLE